MDEVSGRFAKWVYDSGLHDGVEEEALLESVQVSGEVLARGKERIAWDDYVQMIENYHANVGLDGMRERAYSFGTSEEIESFGRMAGLFLSPRRLYHFMYRWVGNHFLRNVDFHLHDAADGALRLVSEIRPDTRGSEVYFLTLTNVLAGTPIRIGLKPARVEITSLSSHRAEYRLVMPKSTGLVRRMVGWAKRFLRSRLSEREIMVSMQEEIREGQSAIDRQRKDFASMIESLADPLFIIGAGGETLFVNEVARRWFMVPEPPGAWRLQDVMGDAAAARWADLLEGPLPGEEEFQLQRSDQGGAAVKLSFRPAQAVVYGRQDAKLLVGRDVTERLRVESQMREAAFAERRRLAVEIHDGLGQDLTGISLRSDTLEKRLLGIAPEVACEAGAIAAVARATIDRARHLAQGLAVINDQADNLRRGLVDHCQTLRESVPFEVVLELPEGVPLTLPGEEALEVLRIVQESCHNAVKHSGGSQVVVRLISVAGGWELGVVDNGRGIASGRSGGMGLKSMPYRAAQLGATFSIGARRDGEPGTEVMLMLPAERKVLTKKEEQAVPDGRIRLVVADDQDVVLDGFVARFSLEPDIEVVGQVREQEEIIPTVLAKKPDVLLTDMMMGAGDNLETIAVLRREMPRLGIVVISMLNEDHYGEDSIRAGADAYLMKSSTTGEVVRVLRSVAAQERGLEKETALLGRDRHL